jgi:hypothetical protein
MAPTAREPAAQTTVTVIVPRQLAVPRAFVGNWREAEGKSQLIMKAASIIWTRDDQWKETLSAHKCNIESDGSKITFTTTEVASGHLVTGEKTRRAIDVALVIEQGQLILTIQPSETLVERTEHGTALVVTSPARKVTYERE